MNKEEVDLLKKENARFKRALNRIALGSSAPANHLYHKIALEALYPEANEKNEN